MRTIVIFFFFISTTYAATHTAASCSQSDVQSAINSISADGDIVKIPACSPNPTEWSTRVSSTTSYEFTIEGAGESSTQLVYSGTLAMFYFWSPDNNDGGFRGMSNLTATYKTLSGIHSGESGVSKYTDQAGRNLDNSGLGVGSFIYNETDDSLCVVYSFETISSTNDTAICSAISGGTDGDFDTGDMVTLYTARDWAVSFIATRTENNHPELYIHDITVGGFHLLGRLIGYHGVISNCTFSRPSYASSYGWYLEGNASDGWPAADPALGTRNAIFVEDNTFQGYCHAVSGFCGVNYVFRYNTRNEDAMGGYACGVDTHGPGYNECWPYDPSDTYNGGRSWEVYNNTFISGDVGAHNGLYQRSGMGLVTGNTFTDYDIGITVKLDDNGVGPLCDTANNCGIGTGSYVRDGSCDDDTPIGECCDDATDPCCQPPTNVWLFDNTYTNVDTNIQIISSNGCLTLDAANGPAVYDEAPYTARDGFEWTAFTYPHPLAAVGLTFRSVSGEGVTF